MLDVTIKPQNLLSLLLPVSWMPSKWADFPSLIIEDSDWPNTLIIQAHFLSFPITTPCLTKKMTPLFIRGKKKSWRYKISGPLTFFFLPLQSHLLSQSSRSGFTIVAADNDIVSTRNSNQCARILGAPLFCLLMLRPGFLLLLPSLSLSRSLDFIVRSLIGRTKHR